MPYEAKTKVASSSPFAATLRIAVKAVIESDFQMAAKRFYETHGNGDAWKDLDTAMWALQGLSDDELVLQLEKVGVGHWTSKLAALHRGKD